MQAATEARRYGEATRNGASLIGLTGVDQITGFRGLITGEVTYISGCNQVLLTPKAKQDGELVGAQWLDEQRIVIDDQQPPVILHNGATPGADRPAPVR